MCVPSNRNPNAKHCNTQPSAFSCKQLCLFQMRFIYWMYWENIVVFCALNSTVYQSSSTQHEHLQRRNISVPMYFGLMVFAEEPENICFPLSCSSQEKMVKSWKLLLYPKMVYGLVSIYSVVLFEWQILSLVDDKRDQLSRCSRGCDFNT